MTYLQFHCIFNIPLLAALTCINPVWTQHEALMVLLVLAIVMVFTSPWDNAAAAWGIWGFPTGKFSAKIGWLPVEEYAFFVLQTLNVILALRAWLAYFPNWRTAVAGEEGPGTNIGTVQAAVCCAILAGWLGAGLWLWRAHSAGRISRSWNYALHLFFWFGPVLVLQWVVAPQLLVAHSVLLLILTAAFGIYYTVADVIAVHGGTWHFDEAQITGWKLRNILPWEEIAFFFLTSLLIAQSYLLFAPGWAR